MEMDMEGFGDLLQQAEQLTADMDNGGELPRVTRNLHQIMEIGDRLWSKTAQVSQDSTDVKAYVVFLEGEVHSILSRSQNEVHMNTHG